jgi:hypothetical protein
MSKPVRESVVVVCREQERSKIVKTQGNMNHRVEIVKPGYQIWISILSSDQRIKGI